MKFLKLSKTGWLILAAGVFVVILAGLGITRSQQVREEERLADELSISQKSLQKLQATDLQQHLDELKQKLSTEKSRLDEVKGKLDQTVVSVDVTDEFFAIADYCGVTVMSMSMSPVQVTDYQGVKLETTTFSASVTGELDDLVDFVISLNNDFSTAVMKSYQISIPAAEEEEELPRATVQMTVYSYYEGKR